MNVDGAIGVIFVDILRCSGMFTPEEAQEIIEIGAINGLFVLGRSIGFIGMFFPVRILELFVCLVQSIFTSQFSM